MRPPKTDCNGNGKVGSCGPASGRARLTGLRHRTEACRTRSTLSPFGSHHRAVHGREGRTYHPRNCMHDMPYGSTGRIDPRSVGKTAARTYWYVLRVLPVTLAVVLGPLITAVYRLTRSAGTQTGSLSLAQAVRGLLCALMLLSLFLSRRLCLLEHRLVRPPLFLATYAVLTSFTSPYPYEHVVFTVKMVFIMLVFASAFQLAEKGLSSERWLTRCAWVVLFMMAACIGVGVFTGRGTDVYRSRYATAGLIDQTGVASFLMLSTLPVFIRLIPTGGAAFAGIMLLSASLFFTMRRSSLIAAAAATCSVFVINLNPFARRILQRRTLVPVAALILLAAVGLSTSAGADLIERFRDLNPFDGSGSGRYTFWRISLEHITDRPMCAQLFGEGLGSIDDLMGRHFGRSIGSHNDWLDFVNAFGLCGLIGISWWHLELARLARHLRNRRDGLFQGACASVIILGLISIGTGGFFEPSWALIYAALGFWAGRTTYERQHEYGGCSVHRAL